MPAIDRESYQAGFKEGFRLLAGDNRNLPTAPNMPTPPNGSNSYREGLKQGIKKAQSQGFKLEL